MDKSIIPIIIQSMLFAGAIVGLYIKVIVSQKVLETKLDHYSKDLEVAKSDHKQLNQTVHNLNNTLIKLETVLEDLKERIS